MKQLDEFDFEFQPSANKRKISELRTLGFLERSENVIFLGPPGVGKTHLAVGLAVEALKNGYTAYFLSAHELITMIRENISTGKIHRKIKALSKPCLLIIDEVGYAADYSVHVEPLNPTQRATRSDVESHPFSWGIPL